MNRIAGLMYLRQLIILAQSNYCIKSSSDFHQVEFSWPGPAARGKFDLCLIVQHQTV